MTLNPNTTEKTTTIAVQLTTNPNTTEKTTTIAVQLTTTHNTELNGSTEFQPTTRIVDTTTDNQNYEIDHGVEISIINS